MLHTNIKFSAATRLQLNWRTSSNTTSQRCLAGRVGRMMDSVITTCSRKHAVADGVLVWDLRPGKFLILHAWWRMISFNVLRLCSKTIFNIFTSCLKGEQLIQNQFNSQSLCAAYCIYCQNSVAFPVFATVSFTAFGSTDGSTDTVTFWAAISMATPLTPGIFFKTRSTAPLQPCSSREIIRQSSNQKSRNSFKT